MVWGNVDRAHALPAAHLLELIHVQSLGIETNRNHFRPGRAKRLSRRRVTQLFHDDRIAAAARMRALMKIAIWLPRVRQMLSGVVVRPRSTLSMAETAERSTRDPVGRHNRDGCAGRCVRVHVGTRVPVRRPDMARVRRAIVEGE